ncbi:MAG: uroporphyrinogen-III synthase [Bacteroidota bacterium]
MKRSVFISRNLSKSSVFRAVLEAESFSIEAWSYVHFEALPFSYNHDSDWLFFYSPRGVQYFFEQEAPASIKAKLAVMGTGTAKRLEHFGLQADFMGTGHPLEVTKQFWKYLKDRNRVSFVQAKHSQNSIAQLLLESSPAKGKNITQQALVTYNNTLRTDQPLPTSNLLVFTSPLNFEGYWKHSLTQTSTTPVLPPGEEKKRYLAIGPTTQKAMLAYLNGPVLQAKQPNEFELAQLVLDQIR